MLPINPLLTDIQLLSPANLGYWIYDPRIQLYFNPYTQMVLCPLIPSQLDDDKQQTNGNSLTSSFNPTQTQETLHNPQNTNPSSKRARKWRENYKTVLCREYYFKKTCVRKKCASAHGPEELKQGDVHPHNFKTKFCIKDPCKLFPTCVHRHATDVLTRYKANQQDCWAIQSQHPVTKQMTVTHLFASKEALKLAHLICQEDAKEFGQLMNQLPKGVNLQPK